jgi:tRNA pseudouridine38-40 synthase
MVIAYEGTNYVGFQLQKNGLSVQEELQKAILKITGEFVIIHGAGRTDAGVHANGQVVNFNTTTVIEKERLKKAINAVLPADILVKLIASASADFHARFSAINKTYSYRIYNTEERPLFERNYVYHIRHKLNVEKMREAIPLIIGEHNFKSFQASGSVVQSTIRTVNFCSLESHGPQIKFIINANGFLYHMVRNIVGTLFLLGQGKIEIQRFQEIILAKDRNLAGPTAPALGLCLDEVYYN